MQAKFTYFTPTGRLDGRGEASYPADTSLGEIQEDVRKRAEQHRLPGRGWQAAGVPCVLVDVPEIPGNRPWLYLPFKDAMDALDCFDVFYARTAEKIQHTDPRNARGIMDMAYSVRRWVRGLVREFDMGSRIKDQDYPKGPGTMVKLPLPDRVYICDFLREAVHEDEIVQAFEEVDTHKIESLARFPLTEGADGTAREIFRRLRSLRLRVLFQRDGDVSVPEPMSEESYTGTVLQVYGTVGNHRSNLFESLGSRNFSPFFFSSLIIAFGDESEVTLSLPVRRWEEEGFALDVEPQKVRYPRTGDRFIVRVVRHYAEFSPRAQIP